MCVTSTLLKLSSLTIQFYFLYELFKKNSRVLKIELQISSWVKKCNLFSSFQYWGKIQTIRVSSTKRTAKKRNKVNVADRSKG